ncbi:hypothetical protein J3R82DRAFT_10335 [Butyriboletus roseoflavus]|nr:hypothetical protein J3R82DRAFT_10335 [Butyriboletus roseoflavus]
MRLSPTSCKTILLGRLSSSPTRVSPRSTRRKMRRTEEDEDEPPKGPAVTTVLCSLTPGKIEQSTCEIILEQDMEYVLEAVGKNTIHVYGNYIDQAPVDQPPLESDVDSDEEDAYNLREMMTLPILDEVESPKNLKRSHEEAMEVDEHEEKPSKSQKKKLAKKLKGADGKAAPAPTPEKKVEEQPTEGKKDKKDKKDKAEKVEKKKEKSEKDGEKKGKGEKKPERSLDGGVKVRDFKVGTGKMAKKGDKVEMRYIGKFLDGKVFDQNTKGKPFVFKLGQGDVIKGWDIGVAGMQIGGEREIVVPPSMGYGNKKSSGIPPNSTLKFEVKLLEIK